MNSRIMKTIALAASAGLALSACTTSDDTAAEDPGTVVTTVETPGDTPVETTVTTADAAEQVAGEDPIFDVINAALAEYPGGIIVDIDREDNTDSYEIDLVQGDQLIELQVDFDGTLREDDREGDDDLIVRAQNATVTAQEAIREALELHPEGLLDELDLEDEDGALLWKVSLDDADRNDLAE
ncbi:MAG TPA: PepSY domain-containing protein, partial [Corynebacterium sp.]|nr:PepSY domain-containing protein [Corynebacterium sp.]